LTNAFVRDTCVGSNNLSGSFPNEIQYLHRLETLSIALNPSLQGHLDKGLRNLYRLKEFYAHYCGLSGSIPSEMGNLQQLTALALANNNLEGSLPDSFYTLENLEVLALDDNMLSGDIEQFSVFMKLQAAYLEDNFFVGTISERLVKAWSSKMVQLDLSRNSIASTIPAGIFAMSTLQVLDLHGNRLLGSIPAIARQNTSVLEFLALHDNDLTGVIPASIMRLAPTLGRLDLSNNNLTTPLPSAIGQLTKLVSLYLGENNFSRQEFPTFLQSLTSLQELSMKRSKLTGTIPSNIRALSLLRLLDLDMNRLVGTIPDSIGFLGEPASLLLNRNRLSGLLPSTFSRLRNLSKCLMLGSKQERRSNLIHLTFCVCNFFPRHSVNRPQQDQRYCKRDLQERSNQCRHLRCRLSRPRCRTTLFLLQLVLQCAQRDLQSSTFVPRPVTFTLTACVTTDLFLALLQCLSSTLVLVEFFAGSDVGVRVYQGKL